MEINGSGGSFVTKEYKTDKAVTWQLAVETAHEMDVRIQSQDDANYLLNGTITSDEKTMLFGRHIDKLFTLSIQDIEGGIQVIVDIRKEQLEVYSFKPQNKETERFFDRLNDKLREYSKMKKCPQCGKRVEQDAKFCPQCGYAF